LIVFLKMIAFLGLSAAFGLWVLPRWTRIVSSLPISQNVLTFALVILLVYGIAAELLGGMAAITGTFIAGLMFSRSPAKAQIESNIQAMSYAFFVPIFFVSIGLGINLRQVGVEALWLLRALCVVAILGKILGAGLGARLGKFSWLESLQLGIGMVSRGEVGLIVASIGLVAGHLSGDAFSAVVGMIIVTTLVTPPMLRAVFQKPAPQPGPPLSKD
jgi:Kef-type K+ transport system membrane component KefB